MDAHAHIITLDAKLRTAQTIKTERTNPENRIIRHRSHT